MNISQVGVSCSNTNTYPSSGNVDTYPPSFTVDFGTNDDAWKYYIMIYFMRSLIQSVEENANILPSLESYVEAKTDST